MNERGTVFQTIADRRSIRNFKDEKLSKEQIETILKAAILSPSGSNKQPWRFIVIESDAAREELFTVMQDGIEAVAANYGESELGSARPTLAAMREAPVTVLVIAPDTKHPITMEGFVSNTMEIGDIVDLQSIGGAIQSMLLTAWEMGIGSLWICDTFAAYPQLVQHYKLEGLLVAAVTFGIANQDPAARPRKAMQDLVQWL